MIEALLGLIVFGAMLVLLWMAMKENNKRLDDSSRRTAPRDVADRTPTSSSS